MTAPHNPLPRRVLVAFMLSGVSALVYEMVWVRLLGDLFGHTAYAVQVVLAVFFGGVALGSFLSDRLKAGGRNLLKIYAAIEVVVAVAGLVFPLSVRLLTPLYDGYAPLELETGWALVFRLALATLLLIIPTALMGATLPLVVKWQSARDGRRGGVATLYAVNTLGGALGAWATAFLLMPLLGVTYTLAAAALGNLIAALLALSARETKGAGASATETESVAATETSNQVGTPRAPVGLMALLLFLTGFIAISLEVLWTRALDQVLSGTIYSFSTVLAVFLLGIALGSWLYRRFLKPLHPFKVFVAVEIVLANYVVASLILVYFTPGVSERLGARLGLGFVRRGVLLESLVSAFMLLVPTLCMGVLFPLLLDAARGHSPGTRVGSLVAANTAGSVLGPVAAGFLLLPLCGLRGSLLVMACLCLGLALVVSGLLVRRAPTWATVGVGTALALTLFLLAPPEVRVWGKPGERLIDFREDPAATVSVIDSGGPAAWERRLKVNNSYSLGGGRGVFTERRQGHLPMLLHPNPRRVLVLGVGTGNTLGAVSLHRPERLLAVELIPSVLELAKKHFGSTNYRVLENPRARVIAADALRVTRATPEKYDVVIADLFHPWQAGVGSLYSVEHFMEVRQGLAEGGVFCQWLPLYQLSGDDLKTVVRTFIGAFPETGAWLGNFGTGTPILALVGSERPVGLQWRRWEEAVADEGLREALKSVYLDQPAEVLGGYVGGRRELERFAGPGAVNTLRRPVIEYGAPSALFGEVFEPSKRQTLHALIELGARTRVPVSFDGSRNAPDEETFGANAEAVRLMIQALVQNESGEKERALGTAIRSSQLARGYGVPAAILTELAWGVLSDSPSAAELGFREALRARPDDPNVLTGLGNVYLALRRPENAAEMFQKALEIRPDWTEATEGLEQARRLKATSGPVR